jgi:ceramide glucosyltransferase
MFAADAAIRILERQRSLFSEALHIHPAAWRQALLILAVSPFIYYLAATFAAWRFFRRERARALPEFTPGVSILKPVYGVDFGSYENFASFCNQNYPQSEILFAVNDESDPAVAVIRRIMQDYPDTQVRLISGAPKLGTNQKVNNLALLAREARHEVLVMSDGDVRVGPNYLREVVAPLADGRTGAVTCLYRGVAQRNLWAQLEAIGAASDFCAGVLLAASTEGVRFALGASIATTKSWLGKIGGFESFANMLADDYELGNRVAKLGARVTLSREVVSTMYPVQTLRGFWQHQVRWAKTIRLCRPASYAALLFTQGLPWTLLAASVAPSAALAGSYLAAYVGLRISLAATVGVWGIRDETLRRKLWLVPVWDVIHFVIWLASFSSNRVVWGDIRYSAEKGQLSPMP